MRERNTTTDTPTTSDVIIQTDSIELPGILTLPDTPGGVVLFAHGSGSSRLSPRNRFVADALAAAGTATLLFDLLTVGEERDRGNVFDISLLADRLVLATKWLRNETGGDFLTGYFGASTGAAAALAAAASPEVSISAVVSRGGRPDLAGPWLPLVRCPTLLIVGSRDTAVVDMNRGAMAAMTAETRLEIVPGATHLFEEPGTLDTVAALAADWFGARFAAAAS